MLPPGYGWAKRRDRVSFADLASMACLSACQFKQSTGLLPRQYLIRCRVEQAKLLLHDGRMTIAEIAHEVGFADQSHLTRNFQRAFGVSPGAVGQNGRNVQKEGGIVQDSRG